MVALFTLILLLKGDNRAETPLVMLLVLVVRRLVPLLLLAVLVFEC